MGSRRKKSTPGALLRCAPLIGTIALMMLALLPGPAAGARDVPGPGDVTAGAGPAPQSTPALPPGATSEWWNAVQTYIRQEAGGVQQALPAGVPAGPGITGLSPTPDWTAAGETVGDLFGWSVSGAGDVNGDGFADVIVGAYNYPAGAEQGKVYLYYGSAAGLSPTPGWTATGENSFDHFGWSMSGAGDVNGDGFADVIVGAYNYPAGAHLGKAYVYHGSAVGLSPTPNWTATGENNGDFGFSVATAGDVNGDGFADVIVGAKYYNNSQGKAYLYSGSAAGLSPTPDWTATGENNDDFGWSVSKAGDVNGDGFADVIIGAPWNDDGGGSAGKAYLYHGSSTGLSPTPDWTATGENSNDLFGYSVATAGDVDGDGFTDVIIGAPSYPNNAFQGKAYVYHGSAAGLSPTPSWTATGEYNDDSFGYSVATAGDVNGDGFADVIVGAPGYPNGAFQGKAYVYHGSAAGLSATAGDVNGDGFADVIIGESYFAPCIGRAHVYHGAGDTLSAAANWSQPGENNGDLFGFSVATAGDVNGDGFTDVVVGAYGHPGNNRRGKVYLYHGSPAGLSPTPDWTATGDADGDLFFVVAPAGDVNGDGFADVAVGAPGYPNGGERGQLYVFHGSPTGLSPTPDWTAAGEADGDLFGWSVSRAGDVNGDGFSDLVVGAPGNDGSVGNAGQAYLFHGSPTGLSATPIWTVSGANADDHLGRSVAAAGDVNGDHFADVIVGAPGDPFVFLRGQAYVYHGAPSGLSATPLWSGSGANDGDHFGCSVAPAGDVNGDGFADVIVGAYAYGIDQGRVYVYYGSSSGLPPTPDWTAGGENPTDRFGQSVAPAGDVDGDGFADVIIGAPLNDDSGGDSGKAYLYHGSPFGLLSAWTATGASNGANFGLAVATAGDVNGDGFADAVVGAPSMLAQGNAYVYQGSAGDGRLALARQFRGDGSDVPVQPWGLSQVGDRFELRMWATDPMGRGRVKLELEACPAGTPFGHAACVSQISPSWTDVTTAPNGVLLSETVTGLDVGFLYRWRARLLYAPLHVTEPGITPPPHPAHGPWRRFLGQSLEADLRTVPGTLGLVLTPPSAMQSGPPGETVTYTLRLSNTGDYSDTFGSSIGGNTWPVGTEDVVGPLAPGDGLDVQVAVGIPADAQDGDYDTAIVTFTSQVDGRVSATSRLTTTAVIPAQILTVTIDISGCVVSFAAEVTGTVPITWLWDFGAYGSSSAPTPTVDFLGNGTFGYALTVFNLQGTYSDTYASQVTVDCGLCAPVTSTTFTWTPLTPTVGQVVTFDGEARGSTPITFTWSFGDGGSGGGATVTHIYTATGTYVVTLTAENICGVDQVVRSLVVGVPSKEYYIYLPIVLKSYP